MESLEIFLLCIIIILWIVFGPVIWHDWQDERKQKLYKIREH